MTDDRIAAPTTVAVFAETSDGTAPARLSKGFRVVAARVVAEGTSGSRRKVVVVVVLVAAFTDVAADTLLL